MSEKLLANGKFQTLSKQDKISKLFLSATTGHE